MKTFYIFDKIYEAKERVKQIYVKSILIMDLKGY